MILKEVYSTMGISADNHVVQQNLLSDSVTSGTHCSFSDTLLDASSPRLLNSVLESRETGLEGIQSDCTITSSHIGSSPVTTYPVDRQSSAALLAAPSGPVAPSFIPSTPVSNSQPLVGMDPTAPLVENKNLGPPPMTGFVKK
jgi:hypothetical protein